MNFEQQLPILPVIIPLIAAPITILLPAKSFGGKLPVIWATLVAWATFFCAAHLLAQVWAIDPDTGTRAIIYNMGGWEAPWGIHYRIDLANGLLITLVSLMAAVIFPYSYRSIGSEISKQQIPYFYAALQICMLGLMGVAITGDAFNVFVFLEVSSLATYALVAMGARRDRRALTSAFNYLVMGTIGATFFVIGLGLLYQTTGTLNMIDLHEQLAGQDNRVVQAGFAFILTGIGLKLAMVPLHLWLPGAYSYAPSAVSAFLAATATKVSIYVMLRFLFTVFGFEFDFFSVAMNVFIVLGLLGMFYASFVAVFRDDVKQLLAYSSIAQIGYILLGISFASVEGLTAALVHLFNHGLMKAALFMAIGAVVYKLGGHHFAHFKGLGKRMPVTATAFLIAALSLVGVPLTAGFVSKYLLITAALETTTWIPASLVVTGILGSSLLAVWYVGRLIWTMFLHDADEAALRDQTRDVPLTMLAPLWIMALANIYFGLNANGITAIANGAAESLIGMGGAW